MLPPSPRQFKDIYVVFELMETDLHQVGCSLLHSKASSAGTNFCNRDCKALRLRVHLQVIKANDDLTPEHHQFFLYQMLRGLKYIHTGQSGTNFASSANMLACTA